MSCIWKRKSLRINFQFYKIGSGWVAGDGRFNVHQRISRPNSPLSRLSVTVLPGVVSFALLIFFFVRGLFALQMVVLRLNILSVIVV